MYSLDSFFQNLLKWGEEKSGEKKETVLELFPELGTIVGYPQNNPYHIYDVWTHTMAALKYSDTNDRIVNLTLLFHDIGKPECITRDENGVCHFRGHGKKSAEITKELLLRLNLTEDESKKIIQLILYHDLFIEEDPSFIKKWYKKLGNIQFNRLLKIRYCDISAQNPYYLYNRLEKLKRIQKILKKIEKEVIHEEVTIAVNGNDLIEIGYKEGPEIGAVLQILKNEVLTGNCNNEKDKLLIRAKTIQKESLKRRKINETVG